MAKGVYVSVNNIARKIKSEYSEVNGVARKVKSGYAGVDGVARQFLSSSEIWKRYIAKRTLGSFSEGFAPGTDGFSYNDPVSASEVYGDYSFSEVNGYTLKYPEYIEYDDDGNYTGDTSSLIDMYILWEYDSDTYHEQWLYMVKDFDTDPDTGELILLCDTVSIVVAYYTFGPNTSKPMGEFQVESGESPVQEKKTIISSPEEGYYVGYYLGTYYYYEKQ